MPARNLEHARPVALCISTFPSSFHKDAVVTTSVSPAAYQTRQLILKSHESAPTPPTADNKHRSRLRYLMKSPVAQKLGLSPRASASIGCNDNYRKFWGAVSPASSPSQNSKDRAWRESDKNSTLKKSGAKKNDRKAACSASPEIVPLVSMQETKQCKSIEARTNRALKCSQISSSLDSVARVVSMISSPPIPGGETKHILAKHNTQSNNRSSLRQPESSPPSFLSPKFKRHATYRDWKSPEQKETIEISPCREKVTEDKNRRVTMTAPRHWTQSQLVEWLQCKVKKNSVMTVPPHVHGKAIMRMTKFQISAILRLDPIQADFVYNRLRAQTDHVERMALKRRAALRKERQMMQEGGNL